MELTTRTPLPMARTGCACCAPTPATPDTAAGEQAGGPAQASASGGAVIYRVQGMTCGHCVASVTEELSGLDGVTAVDVHLAPGGTSIVTVTGPASSAAVRAALAQAGYTPTD